MYGFPARLIYQPGARLDDAGDGEIVGAELAHGHQLQEGVDSFREKVAARVSADQGVPLKKVPFGEGIEEPAGVGGGATGEVHGEEAGGEDRIGDEVGGGD